LVANEELIFERDTNVPTTDICYTRSHHLDLFVCLHLIINIQILHWNY